MNLSKGCTLNNHCFASEIIECLFMMTPSRLFRESYFINPKLNSRNKKNENM